MKKTMWLAAATAALLGGCAGTQATMTGTICGQAVDFAVKDAKDRSGFDASIECPGGGGVHISSTDSSTSAVINAMAGMINQLTQSVAQLAATVAKTAVAPGAYTPPASAARAAALERLAYTIEAEDRL